MRLDVQSEFNSTEGMREAQAGGWLPGANALGHVIDLGLECIDIIGGGKLRSEDLAIVGDDFKRHGFGLVAMSSEIEVEGCAFEMEFESVGKGTAGTIDHTGRACDGDFGRIELVKDMYIFGDLIFHATDGMGRDRLPKKQLDPVQVVNVQIDQWSTDFIWIVEIWDPGWVGDNPFEVSTDGAAEGPFLDQLGRVCEGAHVGKHMGDKSDSAGFFGGLLDLSAAFDGKSDWFFDEDIFAVLHGEDSGIDVEVRW